MAWPPPVLPINRTNADQQKDKHPADHNAANLAINDLVAFVTPRLAPDSGGWNAFTYPAGWANGGGNTSRATAAWRIVDGMCYFTGYLYKAAGMNAGYEYCCGGNGSWAPYGTDAAATSIIYFTCALGTGDASADPQAIGHMRVRGDGSAWVRKGSSGTANLVNLDGICWRVGKGGKP